MSKKHLAILFIVMAIVLVWAGVKKKNEKILGIGSCNVIEKINWDSNIKIEVDYIETFFKGKKMCDVILKK